MRILVTAFMLAVVLASSAFAGNVALTSLGASAASYCGAAGATTPCDFSDPTYQASNAIDGVSATLWLAPSSAINPFVVVNLGSLDTIDSITITGFGNPSKTIDFQVFVSATFGGTETQITPGVVVQSGNSAGWTDTYSVSTLSPIQYIFYDTQTWGGNAATEDYDYVGEISADATPEPGTIGLIGSGLLALGFTLRRKK
jgi:hypothetical protein